MLSTLSFKAIMHSFLSPLLGYFEMNRATATKRRRSAACGNGNVFLIGAGPGSPELLTMQAARLLAKADVILVDWLVNPEIHELFSPRAEVIFVGKRCNQHSISQQEICELLVRYGQTRNNVVRLKGGDPSIFGRLNEETQALEAAGIPFAIVPGVSAGNGCAAYTGIPLTDRQCAQAVRFITAHPKAQGNQPNWAELAKTTDTLVFYMGLSSLTHICNQLQRHGMSPTQAIAVIDKGTQLEQQTVVATLATIDNKIAEYQFSGPSLIIVGEVVHRRAAVNHKLLTADCLYASANS